MAGKPPLEFGRRRPAHLPPAPGPKRSHHVALLLMGTFAVGGTAYAVMPRGTCTPPSPGMAASALPQTSTACTSRSSSGGGYSHSRYSFFSGGGDSSSRAAATSSEAAEGHVSRGGFGSFARAFGFSGRS